MRRVMRRVVLPSPGARPDAGEAVIAWLVRVSLLLAVVGLVALDGLRIAGAHSGAIDDAQVAADAASDAYRDRPDVQWAYTAALRSLSDASVNLAPQDLVVSRDGTVRVTVRGTVDDALVLCRLPVSRSWCQVSATAVQKQPVQ